MIILISKDLFFIPTVKSAAETNNRSLVTTTSLDKPVPIDAPDSVKICIVDLSSVGIAELEDLAESLQKSYPKATYVAFGPHVHVAKLEKASSAGFDHVLSRGQLSNQLTSLIPQWLDF